MDRKHHHTKTTMKLCTPLSTLAAVLLVALPVVGADLLAPLDVRDVKVGGEIGRRIAITVTNNLLKLDVDGDFLRPFTAVPRTGEFIGLGMMLDSTITFAAHTGDAQVLALKKHLVAKTIEAQEADGYIGTFAPDKRIKTIWDVHEMGYIIWALLEDHRYFGEEPSLAAARKAADYLIKNWSALPPDWGRDADVAPHVAFTGIERTMLDRSFQVWKTRYRLFARIGSFWCVGFP